MYTITLNVFRMYVNLEYTNLLLRLQLVADLG